jgi:hypothetical protein
LKDILTSKDTRKRLNIAISHQKQNSTLYSYEKYQTTVLTTVQIGTNNPPETDKKKSHAAVPQKHKKELLE